ncbi:MULTISPECIES: hypothetical protein [unclassified Pseudomonas]
MSQSLRPLNSQTDIYPRTTSRVLRHAWNFTLLTLLTGCGALSDAPLFNA